MRIAGLLFSALAAVSFVPVASTFAGDAPFVGFQKGDWAMTLGGTGVADKDLNDATFSLDVSVSKFLTDNLELGGRQNLSYADDFAGATFVFLDWNFGLSDARWVPFLGANFGYSYGEGISDAWRAGPEGGVKYFVNDTTWIYANVAYEFDLNDGFDSGGFAYGVGLGFRW